MTPSQSLRLVVIAPDLADSGGDDKRALAAYKQAIAIDPLMDNVKKAIDDLESKGKNI